MKADYVSDASSLFAVAAFAILWGCLMLRARYPLKSLFTKALARTKNRVLRRHLQYQASNVVPGLGIGGAILVLLGCVIIILAVLRLFGISTLH